MRDGNLTLEAHGCPETFLSWHPPTKIAGLDGIQQYAKHAWK